jgi:carbohydrate-binding DOMON domain-containing protein
LQDLVPVASDQSTGERYCTGIFIAIKRTGSQPQYRARRFGGVAFLSEDGYDIALSVGFGVSAMNSVRKREFRTDEIRDSITSHDGDSVFFALPVSFLGLPTEDWEYFVGVGMQSDYGAGITYGNPLAIEQHAGPFRCGGGSGGAVSPRFMDVLLPVNLDQPALLSAYDTAQATNAIVPMITLPAINGAAKNK